MFSLDGSPLKTRLPQGLDLNVNNRKLVGHSDTVYDVSFSDSIASSDKSADTSTRFLLSASGDGTIRLWSTELWQCISIYKGHDGAVYRAIWSPHGHYFVSGGRDQTVRVWMQDHASAQRLLMGHETPISAVGWHPNGVYVFSASDETDKTIRMWSVITGDCMRIFVGHTQYVCAVACSPNGKTLASSDEGGNIMFWDIETGTRIKTSRGHGRGGIWSLSFNVEGTVLATAGTDGSVRLWDVELPADGYKAAVAGASGAGGGSLSQIGGGGGTMPATASASASGVGGKRRGKDAITPDQMHVFPTKKTPVIKVQFSRMNLLVAGGCFDRNA